MAYIGKDYSEARFYHVSRYTPIEADRQILDKATAKGLPVKELRYRDILDRLLKAKTAKPHPFTDMLLDYMEDIGVTRYQPIDFADETNEVSFFLAQALGFPHAHGLGKLQSRQTENAVPGVFKRMFDNIEAIAEWIRERNRDLFKQRFGRKYRPYMCYDPKGLSKALARTESNDWVELPGLGGKAPQYGYVYFFGIGSIRSESWLRLEIGMSLLIDLKPADDQGHLKLYLSACFYGERLSWKKTNEEVELTGFPSEKQAQRHYAQLIRRARDKAIKDGTYSRQLEQFQI